MVIPSKSKTVRVVSQKPKIKMWGRGQMQANRRLIASAFYIWARHQTFEKDLKITTQHIENISNEKSSLLGFGSDLIEKTKPSGILFIPQVFQDTNYWEKDGNYRVKQNLYFVPHLFPGTSLGWGVCSTGEDLLPVRLPSSLHRTLFSFLSSAAMQWVRVFEGKK